MSTLAEIEEALPKLSTAELVRLDDAVDATLRARRKVFTGHDALRWWRERERMPVEDADAFATDLEAVRHEAKLTPPEPRLD